MCALSNPRQNLLDNHDHQVMQGYVHCLMQMAVSFHKCSGRRNLFGSRLPIRHSKMHPPALPGGRSLSNIIRWERIWLSASTRGNVSSSDIIAPTLVIQLGSAMPTRILLSVLHSVGCRGIQSSHGEKMPHFCWTRRTNWLMVRAPTRMQ